MTIFLAVAKTFLKIQSITGMVYSHPTDRDKRSGQEMNFSQLCKVRGRRTIPRFKNHEGTIR